MSRDGEMRSYWDRRIVDWDSSSYDRERPRGMMGRLRSSVDARMRIALQILAPHVKDKTLLDLGCGCGRFAIAAVKDLGASRAHGIDISPEAVRRGQELAQEAGIDDRVTFEVGTVERDSFPEADITVGLGLLDWLDDAQTEALLSALAGRRVVLSYSEQDGSLGEIVHRFYQIYWLKLFGGAVRARHHPRAVILELMERHGLAPCEVVADPRARFGRLVHNLGGEP
jgi:ubiquinone/menaquinone biosynthesis C-methylase UbiE